VRPGRLFSAVRASRAAPGSGGDWDTTAPLASSCRSSRDSGGGARGTEQQHRQAELRVARKQRIAKYNV